jgi:hypothetical protein
MDPSPTGSRECGRITRLGLAGNTLLYRRPIGKTRICRIHQRTGLTHLDPVAAERTQVEQTARHVVLSGNRLQDLRRFADYPRFAHGPDVIREEVPSTAQSDGTGNGVQYRHLASGHSRSRHGKWVPLCVSEPRPGEGQAGAAQRHGLQGYLGHGARSIGPGASSTRAMGRILRCASYVVDDWRHRPNTACRAAEEAAQRHSHHRHHGRVKGHRKLGSAQVHRLVHYDVDDKGGSW